MFSEKTFQIAVVISLIAHTAAFFKLPQINLLRSRHSSEQVEVTYIKEKTASSDLKIHQYQQAFPKKSSRETSSKRVAPPPFVKKEQFFKSVKNISIKKPTFHKPEIIAVKKKVTLPHLTNEKITSPAYLEYYQIIREKIRRAAYQNYTFLIDGEAYLSFIILSDGQLKDVRVNEDRSTDYSYLKNSAKKSIYDASPFPKFPRGLDYPELSFNVIISFEVE